ERKALRRPHRGARDHAPDALVAGEAKYAVRPAGPDVEEERVGVRLVEGVLVRIRRPLLARDTARHQVAEDGIRRPRLFSVPLRLDQEVARGALHELHHVALLGEPGAEREGDLRVRRLEPGNERVLVPVRREAALADAKAQAP